MNSVIIKNGTVFDGTGNAPLKTDIAINKEKIIEIGSLGNKKAKLVIDAEGLYIAPGFIDLTTHSDNHWTLFSHPNQESFLRQGITTILGGHGGSSSFPIIKKESIQSLARWVNTDEININWQTAKEFFSEIKKHKLALNFATLVGHETLRRNILGNKARGADKKEAEAINNLLKNSLDEGAFGISTNLGTAYARPALDNEIQTLLKTTANYDAISAHHLEDEGKNLLPAVLRLIEFLRDTGNKGHISHLKALGRSAWGHFKNATSMIETAQQEGVRITCDFFPYTSTGSNLASLLPSWILTENREKILEMLNQEKTISDLIEYFKSLTLHYDKIIIASTANDSPSIGKNIQKISQDSGLSEEETIINLLKVNNLRVSIFNNVILKENIESLSQKPYAMVASDGVGYDLSNLKQIDLPHPRSFGTFPKVLKEFVKEKSLLKWEEAIYKMSGLPAKTLGIKDRGVIKKNNFADIVILDPNNIKDTSTYDDPFHYAEGIEYVFINGQLALAENKLTEARSGKALKRN